MCGGGNVSPVPVPSRSPVGSVDPSQAPVTTNAGTCVDIDWVDRYNRSCSKLSAIATENWKTCDGSHFNNGYTELTAWQVSYAFIRFYHF